MNQKKTNDYPYEKGIQYKSEYANSFEGGRYPEPVKEEKDTLLHSETIGQQSYGYSQASKRKDRKNYQFWEKTKWENEAEEKHSFLAHLQVKPNALRYATLFKVIILYTTTVLGMSGEFLIFQSIAENAFGMSLTKSYLFGLLVLLFTKFVQIAIQPYLKHWIKENNLLLKSTHKIIILVFTGLILLNATMLGITNFNQTNRENKIAHLESISFAISEAEEIGEDTTELETELSQIQSELNEKESGFSFIAKFISIALIGLLTIGSGATLFVFADLYSDALRLKRKLQKERDRHAQHHANFGYLCTTYDDLLSLQQEILQLFAQKQFLEKLLSKEREQDMKIKSQ